MARDRIRFGIVTYSTTAQPLSNLSLASQDNILYKLWEAPFVASASCCVAGLDEMMAMFADEASQHSQVAIVVTDGWTNIDRLSIPQVVQKARDKAIRILAIGNWW